MSITTEQEDDQTNFEMAEDTEELVVPVNERKIISQTKDITLREFLSMKTEGDLILQPDYQRNYVVDNKIASRLIESVLIDIPIPVVYLAEEQDGKLSVIDGQQRLTSFISFIEGAFPNHKVFKLAGLKVLHELNGMTFASLQADFQRKIKGASIHTIVIKKESNEDIKFEIFERLNTGSTKLNEDEIRNSVYRGAYINMLRDLSEDPKFHGLIDNDIKRKRMGYRGLILRFLALYERSYLNYKSPMKQFCNKELRDKRNLHTEKEREYREKFTHCVDMVKVVFGETAFRRYIAGDGNKSGEYSTFNVALFEMQMLGFVNYKKNDILSKSDLIKESLLNLMVNDEDFIQLIGYKTADTDNVKKRFKIYMEMLEDVIGNPERQARTFPYSLKKTLFEANPVCAESGQRILSIDDAEVDHIIPYSMGGKTEESNARLILRYFNRAKGNRVV